LIQIGSDGGLLSQPVSRRTINIAPAERIDVVVDFSSYPLGTNITLKNAFLTTDRNLNDVMQFRVLREERDDSFIPAQLRYVEPIPESLAVRTRTFILAQEDINGRHLWSINRRLFDPAFLDASPRLNSVEIWEFTNNSYDPHPMHIHDIEWQILDISGRKPQPGDDGWKDVFVIPALGRLRVIGRFTDLLGTYVFHCHKLEHEDHAMMGQFQVVP
jgi:spore coat protein A